MFTRLLCYSRSFIRSERTADWNVGKPRLREEIHSKLQICSQNNHFNYRVNITAVRLICVFHPWLALLNGGCSIP